MIGLGDSVDMLIMERQRVGNMPAKKGNSYAKGNPGGGTFEKYKDEYSLIAFQMCLLGSTDAQMADAFGVTEVTINTGKKKHKEFSLALKRGKDEADAVIAQSLYHRAKGYKHEDVDIRTVSLGDNQGSEIVQTPIIKHYPPDTTACIFWLKNRQKDKWRDKTEQDITITDDLAETARKARERAEKSTE
jgi:hypothetical protein